MYLPKPTEGRQGYHNVRNLGQPSIDKSLLEGNFSYRRTNIRCWVKRTSESQLH